MSVWKEIIKVLHGYNTPYQHLKPAFLAQWMLETGRGTSRALNEFLNVAGLKYRPEMEGFAEKVWYKTDSETYRNGPNGWEKGDWFCKFSSPLEAVVGYFHFLTRAPYRGWEQHTATAADFLSFIGRSWCPPGYTPEWAARHDGQNYHEHIIARFYEEARALLEDLGDLPATHSEGVTWFEANRKDDGTAVISACDPVGRSLSNLVGSPAIAVTELVKFFEAFPKAGTVLVAETDKKVIPTAPVWPQVDNGNVPPPSSGKLTGKKIGLDPGHSERKPGAFGKGPNPPSEYEMNMLQAQVIAEDLRAQGAAVTIFDPDPDNLEQVGLFAQGFDAYISLHHNSEDKESTRDEGTETFTHPKASAECRRLAQLIQTAIVKELNSTDRGIKTAAYTVLSVSHYQTDCKLHVLTESYFIDDYTDNAVCRDRSTRSAHAIADAIVTFFEGAQSQPGENDMGPETAAPWVGVKVFKRGEDVQLSKNFHLSEWECNCGCGTTKVSWEHLQKLQAFRDELGCPVRINSAYRCPAYNKKVGGASDSRHMYGDATDITSANHGPSDVYAKADKRFDGVGKYSTFTHVDSRGYQARW